MKQFVYSVDGHEFIGEEAFGDAWETAVAKAKELHAPIFRKVIETREEVYLTCGAFIGVKYATPEDIRVF